MPSIKIHKKLLDVVKDPYCLAVWVSIVINISEKTNKQNKKKFKLKLKGDQLLTSRNELALITGINASKLERVLKKLVAEGLILQEATKTYRIITVKNYKDYIEQVITKKTKKQESYGDDNVNKVIEYFKKYAKIAEVAEATNKQRQYAWHIVNLYKKKYDENASRMLGVAIQNACRQFSFSKVSSLYYQLKTGKYDKEKIF